MHTIFVLCFCRVGRTARAGRSGVSISLAGESERKIVKEIVKRARNTVKSRAIPPNIFEKYVRKLEVIEPQIEKVLQEEQEERLLSKAENQHNRAVKILKGEPDADKRVWFQSVKDRKAEKAILSTRSKELYAGDGKRKKKKPGGEDREPLPKINKGQIHAAKARNKPKRIRSCAEAGRPTAGGGKPKGAKRSSFAVDLSDVSKSNSKRLRYEGNSGFGGGKKTQKPGKSKGKKR